ncbi:hypothetical protein CLF_104463 [Clonorchis sinensis]|uniref:FAR1 domain-containing protein n=1 Tax=Clonorchis sinensis TaxID=79923 RepID=G7YBQ9_CLOSI|nr:hypothetical protein CLF_104463 [Clonorchis sinensis]
MAKAISTVSTTVRPVPILPKPGTSSSGLASSSRNMSLDERNVTRQMMEYFPGRECGSFVEFEYKLREFQRGTGTCYARRHSLSAAKYGQNVGEIIPPSVGYAFMVYKCVHARSHWNASKKGRRYADFDCRSFMRVVHRDGRLVIVSYNMQHTHDLRRCEWQVYAANRHLNAEQERVVFGLLRCFKSSMEIRDYVRKNYGIDLTGDDVRVLRDKLRRLDYPVCDLQGSRNMSLDERNVTRQMMEYFPGRECGSFVEFEYKLREFQRGTGTCYARRHSLSAAKYGQNVGEIITPSVGYAFMVYKCVHARSHWNASKKGRRYADFDCRSFMRVVHRDGRLVIVSYNMQHTHDLRRCEWQVYAANRHLNAEQERVVFGLLRCFKSSMEIRDYVRKNYGIDLTGDDVRVLRDKLRRLDYPVCDLQGIRDALRPFGPMAVPLPQVRQPKLDYRLLTQVKRADDRKPFNEIKIREFWLRKLPVAMQLYELTQKWNIIQPAYLAIDPQQHFPSQRHYRQSPPTSSEFTLSEQRHVPNTSFSREPGDFERIKPKDKSERIGRSTPRGDGPVEAAKKGAVGRRKPLIGPVDVFCGRCQKSHLEPLTTVREHLSDARRMTQKLDPPLSGLAVLLDKLKEPFLPFRKIHAQTNYGTPFNFRANLATEFGQGAEICPVQSNHCYRGKNAAIVWGYFRTRILPCCGNPRTRASRDSEPKLLGLPFDNFLQCRY